MTGQGPNGLVSGGAGAGRLGRNQMDGVVGAVARAALRAAKRVHALVCIGFDMQWEWRRRAYERGLLAGMSARERGDIGADLADVANESAKRRWEA